MRTSSCLALLVCLPPLLAQKMPATGDTERVIAAWPIAEALDRALEHRGNTLRGYGVKPEVMREDCRQRLRNAICKFVEPPLAAEEHVVLLGPDRLVGLVRPTQAAWIDLFFRRLAAADHAKRLEATFQRVTVPVARLAEILGRQDLGEHVEVVVDEAQLKALRTGPRIHSLPMSWRFPHAAWMLLGGGMPFVTDWREVTLRGDDLIAPVLGKVFDGVEFEVQYVPLPEDRIGFALTGDLAIADWKTPTRTKRIGDRDYVIDEPDVKSTRFDATLTMAKPAPFVFGRRIGDDMVLLVFEPKAR